jgi:hypothetical protein
MTGVVCPFTKRFEYIIIDIDRDTRLALLRDYRATFAFAEIIFRFHKLASLAGLRGVQKLTGHLHHDTCTQQPKRALEVSMAIFIDPLLDNNFDPRGANKLAVKFLF